MVRVWVPGGYLPTADRTHLNSGVQEVDPLRNLQIASGRIVERVEIRVRLRWPTYTTGSVFEAPVLQVI